MSERSLVKRPSTLHHRSLHPGRIYQGKRTDSTETTAAHTAQHQATEESLAAFQSLPQEKKQQAEARLEILRTPRCLHFGHQPTQEKSHDPFYSGVQGRGHPTARMDHRYRFNRLVIPNPISLGKKLSRCRTGRPGQQPTRQPAVPISRSICRALSRACSRQARTFASPRSAKPWRPVSPARPFPAIHRLDALSPIGDKATKA